MNSLRMHPHLLSHLRRARARTAGRLAALALCALTLSGCGGGDEPSAPGFSSIGGTVSGLSGNVVVLLNGADAMTLSANGSFSFANPLAQGSLYAVTVASQPSGQLCAVSNAVGTVSAAVSTVAVSCTTLAPSTTTVGGTVSGLSGSGLGLSLNGGAPLLILADGGFTFPQPVTVGASYAVTLVQQPGSPAQTCSVSNGTGTANAAVSTVAVSCTTVPIATFTVGGNVSGLSGSVVLQLNGTQDLTVTGNGSFGFATPLAQGSLYAVTVASQPSGQLCTVGNAVGTVSATVSTVAVSCTTLPPATTTVGGTVSGLSGSGLALSLNGGAPLAVLANGGFTFPQPVTVGASYAVTLVQQPGSPAQTCSVSNGTGTANAAVSTVAVSCTTVPIATFTVGGNVSGLSGSVVLQLNGTQDLTVTGNGSFGFATPLAQGSLYAVTVASQPSGQLCTVGNAVGTVSATVSTVAVSCTTLPPSTTTVGGTVSGLSGSGLGLSLNGGAPLLILANGGFTFPQPVTVGASYAVTLVQQPGSPAQTCTLANASGTAGSGPVSTVTVVCPLAAPVAPALTFGITQFHQLNLYWPVASGASSYQLQKNVASAGWVNEGAALAATTTITSVTLTSVHATRWDDTRFRLQACNAAGCSVGAELNILGQMLPAIGFVKASNAESSDAFGLSVALSADGNTLAVGAITEGSAATGINGNQADNSANSSGAVYVFTRSAGTWSQQAYVKASNTQQNDSFGHSVALSADGNTLAVGAYGEDSAASGINGNQADNSASNSGAVYVFTRSAGTWSQQAYVKASNTESNDFFGQSVALSADGNTLAVGSLYEASAATGINGNQADNSASGSGAVYVYTRSAGTWSQQAYVKASNTGSGDNFGQSVALSADGNTLAVGSLYEASAATGINGNQADNSALFSGAVYVFTRSAGTWSQQAYVKASNTESFDNFGYAVALSADGNTLAVGAYEEASAAIGINGNQADNSAGSSGAVYVYTRSAGTWSQQAYVKASNTQGSDQFGASVALSADGNTLAVGAYGEDSAASGINGNQANNSAGNSGAVYVFTRSAGTWSQQAYVKASNSSLYYDWFGYAVALSSDGNTLAVGAFGQGGSSGAVSLY